MDNAELIHVIQKKLGMPQIKVELDESQWDEMVDETKRWFLGKKGIIGAKSMYIVPKRPIKFSAIDTTYGVDSIVDVIFGVDPAMNGLFYDCIFGVFTNGYPILSSSITTVAQHAPPLASGP